MCSFNLLPHMPKIIDLVEYKLFEVFKLVLKKHYLATVRSMCYTDILKVKNMKL